jgi:predicted MFS family arabinose efflux permease
MDDSADRPGTRLATRLSFFAAGFAMAAWAPLVPFAKANAGVDDAGLGLMLLCLGLGSLVAMPVTGVLAARIGSRTPILCGGFGLVAVLPLLVLVEAPLGLAGALMLFGAALGTLDVAMNIHAVEVERAAPRPLMSGFHAMFSLGALAGAGGVTALLTLGLGPVAAAAGASAVTLGCMLGARPHLLRARGEAPAPFALPRGVVLWLAALAAVSFLVEGAILDWGALLILDKGVLGQAQAGLGYMVFSVAMTIGRLTGDRIVRAAGPRRTLIGGGALGVAGLALMVAAEGAGAVLAGFVLVGFGASNIVPVLFSLAGRQQVMPAGLAVAAVVTVGYAGILIGPALIGFLAEATGLAAAFALIALLLAAVPAAAGIVAPGRAGR